MDKKEIGTIILRSVIGGIIGSLFLLLYSALSSLWWQGSIPYVHLFIFPGILIAILVGVIAGIIVGVAILILNFKYKNPTIVIRIIVGAAVILLIQLIMSAMSNNYSNAGYTEPVPLAFRVINSITMILALGALPGALARPKSRAAV